MLQNSGQIFTQAHLEDSELFESFLSKILKLFVIEEGGYDAVNPNDGNSLSIGILQWHGCRAKKLLERIISKNEGLAKVILAHTAIYQDILNSDEFWDNRIAHHKEVIWLKMLLINSYSYQAQLELAREDIKAYVSHGIRLGISDAKALAYFVDLENQGGPFASERIAIAAKAGAGPTLDALCKAALEDPVMGVPRRSRRLHAYAKINEFFGSG